MSTGAGGHGAPDPAAAVSLGVRLQRRGDRDGARRAFLQALSSGDPDHAPDAAVHLGALLHRYGDVRGAQTAYQQAVASGHTNHAPKAAVQLGILLAEQELRAEAQRAFEHALSSGHPDHAPRAALHLGRLLERYGDLEGARRAYRLAADSGHPYEAPPAAIQLGQLLQSDGDHDGARQAYQRAVGSGHPHESPRAALLLGALLRDTGDHLGARQAFQQVLDARHPDHAAEAAAALDALQEPGHTTGAVDGPPQSEPDAIIPDRAALTGAAPTGAGASSDDRDGVWRRLREDIASGDAEAVEAATGYGQFLLRQGDAAGAQRAYRLAADSGHPEHAPAAALQLGQLLAGSGDHDGAREAYEAAVASGHRDHAPAGAVGLGKLLAERGDADAARAAYQRGVDSGHPEHAPAALCQLGTLLAGQGDTDGAREAYERAIASGHPEHLPLAGRKLGALLAGAGRDDEARQAFGHAIASQHPEHAPAAALDLATLLHGRRDTDGARAAYQWAVESGHPDHAPAAMLRMGTLLQETGDLAGARQAFGRAVDSGHADHGPGASVRLGALLAAAGESGAAERAYRRAAESGHAAHGPHAAHELGKILEDRGDPDGAQLLYQQVVDSGHVEHAPVAAEGVGRLLDEKGDVEGAQQAFQRAAAFGPTDAGQRATFRLGQLLSAQGDITGACQAWRRVTDPRRPLYAVAAYNLGTALRTSGDNKGAKAALRRAAEAKDPDISPLALGDLGMLLMVDNDLRGARRALQQAIASRQPLASTLARVSLGVLCQAEGDEKAARSEFEQAIAAGHPETAPFGALKLGDLLASQKDREGAIRAYQQVVDSGHTKYAPLAAEHLREMGVTSGRSVVDQPTGRGEVHDFAGGRPVLLETIDVDGEIFLVVEGHDGPERIATTVIGLEPPPPDEGLLLPVLQPVDWQHTIELEGENGVRVVESVNRPLRLAGRDVGHVVFGRDMPYMLHIESVAEGVDPARLDAEAFANLRASALTWEPRRFKFSDVEYPGLVCTYHGFAAAGVLDRTLLREAHRLLNAPRLMVGIPHRGLLVAAPAQGSPEQQASFARVVADVHLKGERPITHLTFYATDGSVDGIYEGSDLALAKTRDSTTSSEPPEVTRPVDFDEAPVQRASGDPEHASPGPDLHTLVAAIGDGMDIPGIDPDTLDTVRGLLASGKLVLGEHDDPSATTTSPLADAAHELVAALGGGSPDDEVQELIGTLGAASHTASMDDFTAALTILSAGLWIPDPERAGVAAMFMGAMLEAGAPPGALRDPMANCLRTVLPRCVELAGAVHDVVGAPPDGLDDEATDEWLTSRESSALSTVAAGRPDLDDAWQRLAAIWPAAIALFSVDREAHALARDLASQAERVASLHTGAGWLATMLRVRFDEPFVAIEPATGKGVVGRMSGVVNNFQLNVLLMDAFPGDGGRVSAAAVAAACGEGPQQLDEIVAGTWNLYTGAALCPGGSLPDPPDLDTRDTWIWNEGTPIDIPALDGHRVILLGPPTYLRTWRAQRLFDQLPASLDVEVLDEPAVLDWLERIERAAPDLAEADPSDDAPATVRATATASIVPLLPTLLPLDWETSLATRVTGRTHDLKPLSVAGHHVGFVAFGYDTPSAFVLHGPGDGIDPDEVEAAALANLRTLELRWRTLDLQAEDDEPFGVLTCDTHPAAAAGVLDPAFLGEAQRLLGGDRMLVAVPACDLLLAVRADLPPEQLAQFARAVDAFHSSGDRPVTPLTFHATDGVVDGVYEGSDMSLAEGSGKQVQTIIAVPRESATEAGGTTALPSSSDQDQDVRWALLRADVEAGKPGAVAAMNEYGRTRLYEGDDAGARRAFQAVVAADEPESVDSAAYGLGVLAWNAGDLDEARPWLQRTLDLNHPDHSPAAALLLGNMHTKLGEYAAAESSFRRAVDSGHREYGPEAANQLGLLFHHQEDLASARRLHQHALDSGHVEQAPKAAWRLGVLSDEQGDLDGARRAYRRALDFRHPRWAQFAAEGLGLLLEREGDVEGARESYQLAIDTGESDPDCKAAQLLGEMLNRQGDLEGACEAWRQLRDPEHPLYAMAAYNLGTTLESLGDRQGALTALHRAVDADDPEVGPRAGTLLGAMLAAENDPVGARHVLERVADSEDPEYAPQAADLLRRLGAEEAAWPAGPDGDGGWRPGPGEEAVPFSPLSGMLAAECPGLSSTWTVHVRPDVPDDTVRACLAALDRPGSS